MLGISLPHNASTNSQFVYINTLALSMIVGISCDIYTQLPSFNFLVGDLRTQLNKIPWHGLMGEIDLTFYIFWTGTFTS